MVCQSTGFWKKIEQGINRFELGGFRLTQGKRPEQDRTSTEANAWHTPSNAKKAIRRIQILQV
jgi:hypothetical protein